MNKKDFKQKGITLVGFVITIIVILILIALTITMAINGGLFSYAGNSASKTNKAIEKEQEFANLESNMTVDELVDKYTEVDISIVNIGDYVKYPVSYTNVDTMYNKSSGAEEGYYPKDEFTGWRVLSKETDENGNVLYVKLVSAGVPLSYYHYTDSNTSIENLTTKFLDTEINSDKLTAYKFYTCGFSLNEGENTLRNVFFNESVGKYIDKVQVVTKDDIDDLVASINKEKSPTEYNDYVNDEEFLNLLTVPCKDHELGTAYTTTWIASKYNEKYLWYIGTGGTICERYNRPRGVRVVVYLKPDVKFKSATEKTNGTSTWDISV